MVLFLSKKYYTTSAHITHLTKSRQAMCGKMFQLLPQTKIETSTQLTHDVTAGSHTHHVFSLSIYNRSNTQDECSQSRQISHKRSVVCLAQEEKYQVPHMQDMCISI